MKNLIKEKMQTYGLNNLTDNEIASLIGYKGSEPFQDSSWYAAVLNLADRRNVQDKRKITCSGDINQEFRFLSTAEHEEFWVALLNRNNKIIAKIQVGVGGVSGCVADPKIIFNHALKHLASNIILVHNHPSGNNTPSEQDVALTNKINKGASFFDINLLDHIIIAKEKYYSFADNDLIK